MADQTVTLVLDAEQYHRELAKITAANSRLGNSGAGIGDGIIRGERVVGRAAGLITRDLLGAADAGDAVVGALEGIGRAAEVGLGSAIAIGIGVSLYGAITRSTEAAVKLKNELAGIHLASITGADFLSTDQVSKNIDSVVTKIGELRQRFIKENTGGEGLFNRGIRAVGEADPDTFEQLRTKDAAEIKQLREDGIKALDQQADKQLELNDITRENLVGNERTGDELKIQLDLREKLGQIAKLEATLGVQGVTAAQSTSIAGSDLLIAKVRKQGETERVNIQEAKEKVKIESQGLSPLDEKLRLLNLEIAARIKLVDIAGTQQQRDAASLALEQSKSSLNNTLRNAALAGNIPSSGIQAFKNAFAQQLVRPFNTGPLLENQAGVAEDLSRFQAKQGDLVESARLHRLAVEKHGQAEAIAQGRELLGNETIQNLKFEGLLHLDKLEFNGLKALNNINLTIQ